MSGLLILKVAGRNAVKNRRRSLAVLNAVALSVAVLTFAIGFLVGMKQMFLALAFDTIGHVSIQRRGYLEQAAMLPVNLLVDRAGETAAGLRALPGVAAVTSELVYAGMLLGAEASADVLVRGVDVGDAKWNTRYRQALRAGRFPNAHPGLLLGRITAAYLGLHPGDTATLMAYNANGGVNAVSVTLAGVFETDRTEENEYLALAPIETAAKLLQVEDAATSVLIRLRNPESAAQALPELDRRYAGRGLAAHPWQKVYAEVAVGLVWVNMIVAILFSIIVAVITFGIVNTHLISVFERIRILGTMRSIGLSRPQLMGMVMAETGLIGAVGALAGVALGWAVIRVVARHGIDMGPELDGIARIIYPTFSGPIALFCFAVGILVSLLGACYPAYVAGRMKPLDALAFK